MGREIKYDLTYLCANAPEETEFVLQNVIALIDLYHSIIGAREKAAATVVLYSANNTNETTKTSQYADSVLELEELTGQCKNRLAELVRAASKQTEFSLNSAVNLLLSGIDGLYCAAGIYQDLSKLICDSPDSPPSHCDVYSNVLTKLHMSYFFGACTLTQLALKYNLETSIVNINIPLANNVGPRLVKTKISNIIKADEVSLQTKQVLKRIRNKQYAFSRTSLADYFRQALGKELY